jgi:iron transport multicopper oxidase
LYPFLFSALISCWEWFSENLGGLMTYNRPGIQMRRNSWQDGVLGTNCPIPPTWDFNYTFQVKDQIGSFFYFPSLNLQRASGGFGPFVINNRAVIQIPFAQPNGDFTLLIGDWYTRNHTVSFLNTLHFLLCCDGFQDWTPMVTFYI